MPDLVVMEAQRSADGKCFHYTFTGWNDGSLHGTYFPGNRITVNAAYAAVMLGAPNAALWRQVVDYNIAPYPPPAWPGSGSIPAMAEAAHAAPSKPAPPAMRTEARSG